MCGQVEEHSKGTWEHMQCRNWLKNSHIHQFWVEEPLFMVVWPKRVTAAMRMASMDSVGGAWQRVMSNDGILGKFGTDSSGSVEWCVKRSDLPQVEARV